LTTPALLGLEIMKPALYLRGFWHSGQAGRAICAGFSIKGILGQCRNKGNLGSELNNQA